MFCLIENKQLFYTEHESAHQNFHLTWSPSHERDPIPYTVMNKRLDGQRFMVKPKITRKKSVTESLMILCYTHRCGPCPIIIIADTSFSNGWYQAHILSARQAERVSTLQVSISSYPSEIREPCEREEIL